MSDFLMKPVRDAFSVRQLLDVDDVDGYGTEEGPTAGPLHWRGDQSEAGKGGNGPT